MDKSAGEGAPAEPTREATCNHPPEAMDSWGCLACFADHGASRLHSEIDALRLALASAESRAARAASDERERCAKLCEAQHGPARYTASQDAHYNGTRKCAAAIRALAAPEREGRDDVDRDS